MPKFARQKPGLPPVSKAKTGLWRIGRGRAIYRTREQAERMLIGDQAVSQTSVKGVPQ